MKWIHEFIHSSEATLLNCVIHPLLPFLPRDIAIKLHRWHARYAFGGENNLN